MTEEKEKRYGMHLSNPFQTIFATDKNLNVSHLYIAEETCPPHIKITKYLKNL